MTKKGVLLGGEGLSIEQRSEVTAGTRRVSNWIERVLLLLLAIFQVLFDVLLRILLCLRHFVA